MNKAIPRLRMFAGPNGSGKSTLKSVLPRELLGVYLNPDEIESQIRQQGFLPLAYANSRRSKELNHRRQRTGVFPSRRRSIPIWPACNIS